MIHVIYEVGTDDSIFLDGHEAPASLFLETTGLAGHEFLIKIQNRDKNGERNDFCDIYFSSENSVRQLIHGLQVCLNAQEFDDEKEEL